MVSVVYIYVGLIFIQELEFHSNIVYTFKIIMDRTVKKRNTTLQTY